MTTPEILDGIFSKQREINMNNQQLSDASGVPKATIERIKRGDTPNPTMDTILALSAAVGYTFSNQPEPKPPIPETVKVSDPILQILLAHYEKQEIDHAESMKRVVSHFNMQLAEKNREIRSKSITQGLLIIGFITLLLVDIATPDLGWFPHDANSITIGLCIFGVIGLIGGAYFLHKNVRE